MLAEKDPYIDSAYQKLQVISQDKQKRLEYEARQKAILDHNQFLQEARQSGLEEGISIGEKRGKKQGEAKKTIDIAKNLIAAGLASDLIADATGLSLQDVEALRNHSYLKN